MFNTVVSSKFCSLRIEAEMAEISHPDYPASPYIWTVTHFQVRIRQHHSSLFTILLIELMNLVSTLRVLRNTFQVTSKHKIRDLSKKNVVYSIVRHPYERYLHTSTVIY